MSYQQTFTCDICGAVKQETNHWVLAGASVSGGIQYRAWDLEDAIFDAHTHLCGEQCALKHLSNYLGKLKEGTA